MLRRSLLSCIALFAFASSAQAAPLNLILLDSPDIVSAFINVTYDATSDSLSAMGSALEINHGGMNNADITGGLFALDAVIDAAGSLVGGTLSILGNVPALGYASGTVLTGTLDAFGFAAGGDPLEFLFTVTGGDAAALYGGIGATGGIILSQTGATGSWDADFANDGFSGVADVAAIPLPAAAWLFLTALLSLGATRRRA